MYTQDTGISLTLFNCMSISSLPISMFEGTGTRSLPVYVKKLNVVIFFAIILQNTFKIS